MDSFPFMKLLKGSLLIWSGCMYQSRTIWRFCSSALPLPPLPNDLLRAPDPCLVKLEPFTISVGQIERLEDAMDREKLIAKEKTEESVRKTNFEKFFRAALMRRGLLWTQPLHTEESRMLNCEYRHITGAVPKYLTAGRFAVHVEEMPRPQIRHFLDDLCYKKAIVLDDWIDDWTSKLETSLGITMYDLGLEFADQEELYCKSESDSSYSIDKKKADVAALLWVGSQICLCEIYCDVPCNSSTMAEAKGVYLQIELGIPLQYLSPCNNYPLYRVVKGELLELKDDNEGMCALLRHMKVYFKGFEPRWVPREELSGSVDGLLRDRKLKAGPLKDASNQLVVSGVIRRLSKQLNGQPIFTIQGKQPSVRKPIGCTPLLKAECYLEVEEEEKTSTLFHIINALHPSDVSIVCKDCEHVEKAIVDQFGCMVKKEVSGDCHILSFDPPIDPYKEHRNLVVVFDSSLQRDRYLDNNSYTIYLATAKEKENLQQSGLTEYGPLSFVALHQVQ